MINRDKAAKRVAILLGQKNVARLQMWVKYLLFFSKREHF